MIEAIVYTAITFALFVGGLAIMIVYKSKV